MGSRTSRGDETVVAWPAWVPPLLWGGFPLLGAGVGWLLALAASWVASLPWAPFQGPFELVASMPQPWATIGPLAVGAVAGLVLAFLAHQEDLVVTVSADRVTLTRGGSRRDIERGSVGDVFVDGKQLVLLDRDTAELAREKHDLSADHLGAAFREHGFGWRADGDPYVSEYRRWVENTPDLPAGADALLGARARTLDKGDDDDAAQLRTELSALGIVVRDDEKKRQYWRRWRHGRDRADSAGTTDDGADDG